MDRDELLAVIREIDASIRARGGEHGNEPPRYLLARIARMTKAAIRKADGQMSDGEKLLAEASA
jgi:hypothetical protein